MNSVEERLAHPFYLKMMGFNAIDNAHALWTDLTHAGKGVTTADVKELLAADWRPVVMGSWFSLKFEPDEVGGALRNALSSCGGTLTAPSLSVAALIVMGEQATGSLLAYIERDLDRQQGAAGFVAAVVEELGSAAPVSPDERDRRALVGMLDVAHRFRSALTAD